MVWFRFVLACAVFRFSCFSSCRLCSSCLVLSYVVLSWPCVVLYYFSLFCLVLHWNLSCLCFVFYIVLSLVLSPVWSIVSSCFVFCLVSCLVSCLLSCVLSLPFLAFPWPASPFLVLSCLVVFVSTFSCLLTSLYFIAQPCPLCSVASEPPPR